jgi:signal transduction histidine kinase
MSAAFMRRTISRSVAWRLAAGVLPSVLAVGLVIGLFYYGEYGRAAPRIIQIVAAGLTLLSIVVAWINATYFAERLARLARATEQASGLAGPTDEFDRIEQAVGNLGSALTAAEAERARTNAVAAARLKEESTMLAGVVNDAIAQLDEVRLPLQILLESPFGELNENQEELLRDARAAADTIDVALRRLAQVADVDREALPVQRELVQVNDVVRSVLPLARAAAERQGARTESSLEPGLPRVLGDRARLAEALSLFVTSAAAASGPDKPLTVGTARDGSRAIVRVSPADGAALGTVPALILAARLISAQGGSVSVDAGILVLSVGSSVSS